MRQGRIKRNERKRSRTMTSHLPSQLGLSTPDALRRLSAALHIFECPQMPWGTKKRPAKPSPKSSCRTAQKRQSARVNCTFLPPARALITSGEKGVVKWCHGTAASLNDGVHQCLTPATAAKHDAPGPEASTRGVTVLNAQCPDNFTSGGDFSIYLSAQTSGEICRLMEAAG